MAYRFHTRHLLPSYFDAGLLSSLDMLCLRAKWIDIVFIYIFPFAGIAVVIVILTRLQDRIDSFLIMSTHCVKKSVKWLKMPLSESRCIPCFLGAVHRLS